MSVKHLIPSTDAKNHIDENGEIIEPMYRTGSPRVYRFDAGSGVLNLNGKQNLTSPGDTFKIKPIGARIFEAELFAQDRKMWAEIFFINTSNQVCSVLFHGFSVENLGRLEDELYYEGVAFDQVILTVKLEQHTNKAANSKYYIAEFSIEKAPDDLVSATSEMTSTLPLYRRDTLTEDTKEFMSLNYAGELPEALPNGDKEALPEKSAATA